MSRKPNIPAVAAGLRRRAWARLREGQPGPRSKAGDPKSGADTVRVLQELEVHQIELELQNAELQKSREQLEAALEKYTDLYDFAPIGYLSIDESGVIQEVNLTGAVLLGLERSRLVHRGFLRFVAPTSQPIFRAFLERIFAGTENQVCEAKLTKGDGPAFWASFHGASAISAGGPRKCCRVSVSDITSLKRAEEAQRRLDVLAAANRQLRREIERRQATEEALKKSYQHSHRLLKQSQHMQKELRLLSRQLLSVQEEERKRISRELHDVVAQTLTGINVQLATLKAKPTLSPKVLARTITRTQQLVEQSVDIVHRFAGDLRPTVLDDLGLIPALHLLMKGFRQRTGIRVSLSASAAVEQVSGDKRIVLFRVAQEALANVARHAQASQAEVRIQKLDRAVCMKIKDNGRGFQEERVRRAKRRKRLGLLGMRERLEMVGGNIVIESVPGEGTTIQAQIPLNVRARGTQRSPLAPCGAKD